MADSSQMLAAFLGDSGWAVDWKSSSREPSQCSLLVLQALEHMWHVLPQTYMNINKNKSLLRKERSTVLQCLLFCQQCCVVSVFAGEDDKLILCDECNKAFHLFCLRPALYEVPDGEWQCPACQPPTARRNSRGR